ncbi:hypothetical protein C8R45DRAFT_939005 [Mycena sanguinolenta]|nr:hypothetical protein C8R45DRAFT_939005 [Mycena sanguinolenta]
MAKKASEAQKALSRNRASKADVPQDLAESKQWAREACARYRGRHASRLASQQADRHAMAFIKRHGTTKWMERRDRNRPRAPSSQPPHKQRPAPDCDSDSDSSEDSLSPSESKSDTDARPKRRPDPSTLRTAEERDNYWLDYCDPSMAPDYVPKIGEELYFPRGKQRWDPPKIRPSDVAAPLPLLAHNSREAIASQILCWVHESRKIVVAVAIRIAAPLSPDFLQNVYTILRFHKLGVEERQAVGKTIPVHSKGKARISAFGRAHPAQWADRTKSARRVRHQEWGRGKGAGKRLIIETTFMKEFVKGSKRILHLCQEVVGSEAVIAGALKVTRETAVLFG